MIKVVLDTNVLISALIKRGPPRELIFELITKKIKLVLSKDILQEFVESVGEPKIRKYIDEEDLSNFIKIIGSISKLVRIRSKFKIVQQDPDDDIILRTAYDGGANYIVSGDAHLLNLKKFKRIKIITTKEMLELIKAKESI